MTHHDRPPVLPPDLGPQNAHDAQPEQFTPPIQGAPRGPEQVPPSEQFTLPTQGPGQQKLDKDSIPDRPDVNEGAPDWVRFNTGLPKPERVKAAEELVEAVHQGRLKSGVPELLAAGEPMGKEKTDNNPLVPQTNRVGILAAVKKAEVLEDPDIHSRNSGSGEDDGIIYVVGGFGEGKRVLRKMGRAMAEEEGVDPKKVRVITMAQAIKHPERILKAGHLARAVLTHSAGETAVWRALTQGDTAKYRKYFRPGIASLNNPPSEETPPPGDGHAEGKKMNTWQLLKASMQVLRDDMRSHSGGEEFMWRTRWWGQFLSHLPTNIMALPKIAKSGPAFAEFAASLARQGAASPTESGGTHVMVNTSQKDGFFRFGRRELDLLMESGVSVAELPDEVGPDGRLLGRHNRVAMFPAKGFADVEDIRDRTDPTSSDPRIKRDHAARRGAAERRRHYRRRGDHRSLGISTPDGGGTPSDQNVDDSQPTSTGN